MTYLVCLILFYNFSIIFVNFWFSLWWSSLKSIFREINFSVVSGTMVFLFLVWMVVLFKTNPVFPNLRFANSLIYWNKNNITRKKWLHKVLCPAAYILLYLKREHCFQLKNIVLNSSGLFYIASSKLAD